MNLCRIHKHYCRKNNTKLTKYSAKEQTIHCTPIINTHTCLEFRNKTFRCIEIQHVQ